MAKSFLIGELARRAGVNKETVRFYESKGLLTPPERRESGFHSAGYRQYADETVLLIKMIKQLKQLGFTLREIKLLFDLFDGGSLKRSEFLDKWLAAITEIVALERKCCGFVRFRIVIEPEGKPIWLELAGPEGTKEFLKAQLGF